MSTMKDKPIRMISAKIYIYFSVVFFYFLVIYWKVLPPQATQNN